MMDIDLCPICLSHSETVLHILWECPASIDVHSSSTKGIQKMPQNFRDLTQLWSKATDCLTLEDQAIMATSFRAIWHRRNLLRHGGQFTHPSIISQQAIRASKEISHGLQQDKNKKIAVQSFQTMRWNPPAYGCIKVNWDAAFQKGSNRTGLGCIARDELGQFISARMKSFESTLNPVVAEALGAMEAVLLISSLGLSSKIELEGDALQVVNALNSTAPSLSSWGGIVQEIQASMAGNEWIVSHISRSGNRIAHLLAKAALSKIGTTVLHGDPPRWLGQEVEKEFSVVSARMGP